MPPDAKPSWQFPPRCCTLSAPTSTSTTTCFPPLAHLRLGRHIELRRGHKGVEEAVARRRRHPGTHRALQQAEGQAEAQWDPAAVQWAHSRSTRVEGTVNKSNEKESEASAQHPTPQKLQVDQSTAAPSNSSRHRAEGGSR